MELDPATMMERVEMLAACTPKPQQLVILLPFRRQYLVGVADLREARLRCLHIVWILIWMPALRQRAVCFLNICLLYTSPSPRDS